MSGFSNKCAIPLDLKANTKCIPWSLSNSIVNHIGLTRLDQWGMMKHVPVNSQTTHLLKSLDDIGNRKRFPVLCSYAKDFKSEDGENSIMNGGSGSDIYQRFLDSLGYKVSMTSTRNIS